MIVGLFSAGKGGQGTELLALEFFYFYFPVSRLAYWIRGCGVLCLCVFSRVVCECESGLLAETGKERGEEE